MTAPGVASAAPIKAATCSAIDASKTMNDLPASADCATAVATRSARATQAVRPNVSPVSPTTTISSSPRSFDRTNGDILAITRVQGALVGEIAFGGNFSAVSALFGITSWNPKPSGTVRALAAAGSNVFMAGGFSAVRAVSSSSGSTVWTKSTSSGDVHSLLATGGKLYAGGLFEKYNGTTQHGLVEINPSSGSLVSGINAHLRADTGVGQYGQYDGEETIALSAGPNSGEILAGSGGHAPAGDSSNEAILINANTGSRVWTTARIGDCQGIGLVGSTVVAGYHRNNANTSTRARIRSSWRVHSRARPATSR